MIDIIIHKQDSSDACSVHVMHSTECGSDHKLVRGKFKLHICKRIRMDGVKASKEIDVTKLKQADVMCNCDGKT